MRRRPALLSLAAVAALTLSACADEAEVRPSGEVVGGNAGVDETVDADITVQDVELEFVEGGYAAGDDADLYLAITNRGTTDAELVEVRTDAADSVTGDLPITAPAGDNVYVGAEGGPDLTLVGLAQARTSSQSVPVTFVFADGDEVTVEAVVAAQPQDPDDDDFDDPDQDTSSDS
ncbi:Copper(I)-binding protein [Klenkia soli]|uniref:Copper(I)-binding protein n=1 Tax=Klenkia soli TaxID=1052260 RepID=A0A1H0BQN1_9ACTN|nr:copper chaperone PCu(A)C [Klenkia soli]SDN47926.1 Copper(I)-binding protein [Klenkia soli]